tara:strand:+ start:666155 stop:667021 length:867 start_codon:yes stop_codon:yes gene_type:complete
MKDQSKSVKQHNFQVPQQVIGKAKFLQFFSKSLTSNFLTKLFITPFKYKTPEREEMMRESAKKELVLIPALGYEVMVYTYGYSKTKILLAHAWSGRGTQMYAIADLLLENGMMVLSFDAPAHGLSKGKTITPIEYVKTIEFLSEKYGPFDAAVGHSYGAISLLKCVSNGLKIDKLVTIGTTATITNVIVDFIEKFQLKPTMVASFKKKLNSKFKQDIDAFSPVESAKNIEIPTLVIHDTKDTDVDVSSAFKLRQNLKQGTLLITNGLGHRSVVRDATVLHKICAFIKG